MGSETGEDRQGDREGYQVKRGNGCYSKAHRGRKSGNSFLVVLVLFLLIGAGAWWFLFRNGAQSLILAPAQPAAQALAPAGVADEGSGLPVSAIEEVTDDLFNAEQAQDSYPAARQGGVTGQDLSVAEISKGLEEQFSPPPQGLEFRLLLRSGKHVRGKIQDIGESSVTLDILGVGNATYSKSQISARSRVLLFKDDYVRWKTAVIMREKAAVQGEDAGE